MALDEPGAFKLMVWYDNEWSYAHKTIKLLQYMIYYNKAKAARNPFFIANQTNLQGKKVVLRLDWNIPLKANKEIDSYFRIQASLHTLQYILSQRPEYVVIVSHLGRPKPDKTGQKSAANDKYSFSGHLFDQIRAYLAAYEGPRPRANSSSEETTVVPKDASAVPTLRDCPLQFLPNNVGAETFATLEADAAAAAAAVTATGGSANPRVYLLENIRFHEQETEGCGTAAGIAFRDQYVKLGNFFVNDAFATAHRDHVSVTGCAALPRAYGYLIEKETRALSIVTPSLHRGKHTVRPSRSVQNLKDSSAVVSDNSMPKAAPGSAGAATPFLSNHRSNLTGDRVLAIIGGGKMDDKLPLLDSLSIHVAGIYIAGGNINSILNNPTYNEYIQKIAQNPDRADIYLMSDGLASSDLSDSSLPIYQSADSTRDASKNFFDIGLQSIVQLDALIRQYDLVFWNGTLGVVEHKLYSYGSTTLVKMLMSSGKKVVVGGGDTSAFVEQFQHNFTYVSTGGGASLEYLSNEDGLVGLRVFNTPDEN